MGNVRGLMWRTVCRAATVLAPDPHNCNTPQGRLTVYSTVIPSPGRGARGEVMNDPVRSSISHLIICQCNPKVTIHTPSHHGDGVLIDHCPFFPPSSQSFIRRGRCDGASLSPHKCLRSSGGALWESGSKFAFQSPEQAKVYVRTPPMIHTL